MTDGTPVSDHTDGEPGPGSPGRLGNDETLDRRVIAEFRLASPDSPAFVSMLFDQFVEEATAHAGTLRDAAQRHDEKVLRDIAHNLKGSSRTIGATRLAALCEQVENKLNRGAGNDVGSLAAAIDEELTRVRDAFAAELVAPQESVNRI